MFSLVSIIIPVYNTEKYLEECIKSLLSQSLCNCEFIFVNDGSNDNSINIIKNHRKKDERIILINQKNQGVSEARNTGILNAKGKYIGFVDSDDYIDSDMYEELYKQIQNEKCDIIISNFEEELNGNKCSRKYSLKENKVLDKNYIENEILPFLLREDSLNTVCNKLYKKSIIDENNIRFPKGVPLGEDGIFNMIYFSKCNSCKYIDYTGYHYREVNGSATRNLNKHDYFQRELDVYNFDLEKLIDMPQNIDIKSLKSVKLINNIKSNIYIYFEKNQEKSIFYKCKYIKNIVNKKEIKEALEIYLSNENITGRYEKLFLLCMKNKLVVLLYILCTYSRIRNK